MSLWCRKGFVWSCISLGILVSAVITLAVMEVARAESDTQFVPMMMVSERYDSNILRLGKAAVRDVDLEDYVTTLAPQLVMRSRGGPIEFSGAVGAMGEIYVNNSALNYIGVNSGLGVGLTPLISRAMRNASLNVFGSYAYTPNPPAFLGANTISPTQDSFVRGLQTFRANTTRYTAGETFRYQFTPLVVVNSAYLYSRIKFGNAATNAQGTRLLGTENHQFILSPAITVSAADTLAYSYTFNTYSQQGIGSFSTHSNSLLWKRFWHPSLSTQVSGGAQYLGSLSTRIGNQTISVPSAVSPIGSVLIAYNSNTALLADLIDRTGDYSGLNQIVGAISPGGVGAAGSVSINLNYNYGAFPLFVESGGFAKSHVVSLNGAWSITSKLTVTLGGNFSQIRSTGGASALFEYENISGNAGLTYLVIPSLRAGLNYIYSNSYGIGNNTASSIPFLSYSRQVAILSLTYAFGGGAQFFQGGGFFGPGISGPGTSGPGTSGPGGTSGP